MTSSELRATKRRVMGQYRPYTSQSLSGLLMDCQAYLDQSLLLRVATSKGAKTGDTAAMLLVRCVPRRAGTAESDIVAEVERIWMRDLRLTEEAHTIERREDGIALDFVTWSPASGSFATGMIVIMSA